jgi:ketosteroid isomerase-like protein
MIKGILLLSFFLGFSLLGCAQNENEAIRQLVLKINKEIDHAVVKKDVNVLRMYYADDFQFTHGTGKLDTKNSWIKTVQRPDLRFTYREHDSTLVEVHEDITILTGRLMVASTSPEGVRNYGLKYVRVYALRKKNWQLISHRTLKEWTM